MKTVLFLAPPGSLQEVAYSILEEMWTSGRIEQLYRHVSKKEYKRWPDQYDLGITFLYNYHIPSTEENKSWVHLVLGNPSFTQDEFGGTLISKDGIVTNKFLIDPDHDWKEIEKRGRECLLKLFFLYVPDIINRNENICRSILCKI